MSDIAMNISTTLKELREVNGWSQADLAEQTKAHNEVVTVHYIRKLEQASNSNPTLSVMTSLAKAFGMSVGQLADKFAGESE